MVVFFDIDGTIVDNDTQIIPDSAVEAIRLLRSNGHIPVVNTGRPLGHIDPRIRQLDFDGWIGACGMEVILNGVFIHQDYPSADTCSFVIDQCKKNKMLIQAETADALYYDAEMTYPPGPLQEAARLAKKGIRVMPYQEAEDRSFIKFVTHETEESDRAAFLAAVEPIFHPMIHRGTMIEYSKQGNTKAKGMENLKKAAAYITDSVLEDGVFKALRHFGLI